MKRLIATVLLTLLLVGCRQQAQSDSTSTTAYKVTLYNGGTAVREWKTDKALYFNDLKVKLPGPKGDTYILDGIVIEPE